MFDALAKTLSRHRRVVLGIAILLIVIGGLLSLGLSFRLTSGWSDWDDPGAANVAARDTIEKATGIDPQQGYLLVVRLDQSIGPADPPPAVVTATVNLLQHRPEVRQVLDYATSRNPGLISRDGRSTVVVGLIGSVTENSVIPELRDQIAANPLLADRVMIGGTTAANVQIISVVIEDLSFAELIVFPLLFALLVVVFRGVVSALVPLVGGVFTILSTMLVLRGVAELTNLSVFALNLVLALGLGLSIDFSLLIISRFREQLQSGGGAAALRDTMNTAGRTVLFSGLTITCSLSCLFVFPQRFLSSMAFAGVIVTVAAMSFALVVLPAILAVLGGRIESWAPRRWQRRHWQDGEADLSAARWRRFALAVMRRPLRSATAVVLLLAFLAIPVLDITFTPVVANTRILPDSVSAGHVANVLATDFDDPIPDQEQLVVDATPADAAYVADYTRRVAAVAGVVVALPQPLDAAHWLVTAYLADPALSSGAQRTVRTIEGMSVARPVNATGPTADGLALNRSLADHIPVATLILVLATFVILFAMTGSVVLPVKAVVMNLLSLTATFGILTFVFQQGHLASLFGTAAQGGLESTSPLILFAAAFGLSTDYGVFLLGRIREERRRGLDDRAAVASGMEHTGRIITSAAALFCIAMIAMVLSRLAFIKELGLGTALAVIIDASVVRAVLVPALMTFLGRVNWWAPRPLRRLHTSLGLENLGD